MGRFDCSITIIFMPNVGVSTGIDTSEKSLGAFEIRVIIWAVGMTSEIINEILKSEKDIFVKE